MNNIGKYAATALAIGIMVAALSGCEKGPAEKAGADKIEDAVDNAKK
jgi:hypothetical protein